VIKSKIFLAATLLALLLLAGLVAYGRRQESTAERAHLARMAPLITALELTDLSIWTEARYTRHPSQADFFSAFQDFPAALEHFPAGSVVSPPIHLWTGEMPEGETAPSE
jgi:hypothetical protein